MRARSALFGCLVVAVLATALAGAYVLLDSFRGTNAQAGAFDEDAWKSWSCCEDLSRYNMVPDLRRMLPGMSEAGVVSRLGAPDFYSTSTAFDCDDVGVRCLGYNLGLEPGFRIDPEHLLIRIRDGRVDSVFRT